MWGSAKKMLPGGWGMKATADMSDRDLTSAAVTMELENVRNDLTVKVSNGFWCYSSLYLYFLCQ